MDGSELLVAIPKQAKDTFYLGAIIGSISWFIGSPILGKQISYGIGSVIGIAIGSVLVGLSFSPFLGKKKYLRVIGTIVLIILFHAFVCFSELTINIKDLIKMFFPKDNDVFFLLSYIIVFGSSCTFIHSCLLAVRKIYRENKSQKQMIIEL